MGRTAEAIVVGAGVIGASVAFNLTRLGLRDVVVLERGTIAGAASGRSGALVRTHYTNAPEARLALAAQRWFHHWGDLVGGDCGFTETGFLQLVRSDDAGKLRANVAMLREIGADTRLLDAGEVAALQPGIAMAEGELAAYEPRSGYADPLATTRAFVAAAERGGATVIEGTAVTALRGAGGRIAGVETTSGSLDAPIVVLATGAWSVALLRPLGVGLPIRPTRAQVAFFARPSSLPRGRAGHPAIIDRANGFYARPHGDDLTLVGLSAFHHTVDGPDSWHDRLDPEFPPLAVAQIARRLPTFAGAACVRGHAGPLDVTTDGKAILDRAPGTDGLYLAVGMSGTGFKKAPAIGACLAELILEGTASTAPLAPFRLARFAENDPIVGNDYTLPHEVAGSGRGQPSGFEGRSLIH